MSRRKSHSRAERREGGDGTKPKMMSLSDWLAEPTAVARRGEVWGVLQLALELERKNRWRGRVWRWITGSPLVNVNPFKLWSRMTGTPEATTERPTDEQLARGEQLPPEDERRIVTL
jgi:hypothetical protein